MKWNILAQINSKNQTDRMGELMDIILRNRGINSSEQKVEFFSPPDASDYQLKDLKIDPQAIDRMVDLVE